MDNRLRAAAVQRRAAYVAAVLLIFLFYMLWPVNFYLARNLKTTWYMMAVPVLAAGVLYFRRLRDGWEAKLLALYYVWYLLSRILNGDPALVEDFVYCFDLLLMLPFFLLGLTLDKAGRRRFLDLFSALVGVFHFVLGGFALAAYLLRTLFVNPITGGYLGLEGQTYFTRINILDVNPNSTAFWFMAALLLMVYQFFACKRKLWRIPIVIAALVDYLVISVTYTRSVKLALAVAFGLLAVLLVRQAVAKWNRALSALVLVLVFAVSAPLVYKSFDLATQGLGSLSVKLLYRLYPDYYANPDAQEGDEAEADKKAITSAAYTDPRSEYESVDSLSSSRMTIYKGALYTIQQKPMTLLRGCLTKDSMTLTNEYGGFKNPKPHYHDFLFQILIITGLPGLLLAMSFCLLLVFKTVKLFFSPDSRADLSVKTLCLPVTAVLVYYLFEVSLFTEIDVRVLYSLLFFGLLLGFYKDIDPRRDAVNQADR